MSADWKTDAKGYAALALLVVFSPILLPGFLVTRSFMRYLGVWPWGK
jgi:hypothetical protein